MTHRITIHLVLNVTAVVDPMRIAGKESNSTDGTRRAKLGLANIASLPEFIHGL